LRPLLEDRGRITELIRILVPVDRMKHTCFQITTKRVRRSQQFSNNVAQIITSYKSTALLCQHQTEMLSICMILTSFLAI